ncbi:pyridoxamine 5'-phosphate oxidase family protein [Herbiconiux sp. VKM Ac-2851]|jgi:general stress protein 26|uniref:pyridoxamine 5'-phosphate oxidase family protein n=1 Tax=Herbiconiux sp. VKM Ac-2851 TaxID=2739025 RepID=UPI0015665018|nr:pyridoxamine 5'-phosphate oxidase family protein [Herbiconiux sp. VKM Ac-2851]NQX35512.1 pyridoxamine 5'-phosphate oxidase family protein [Herbiconiux sp. VKM Ac-2851]
MTEKSDTETLAGLVKDFRFAMLTTVDDQGRLVAHPLTVQEAEFDGDLWFIVGAHASALQNLQVNPTAGVTLSSNDSWVSLTGTAAEVADQAKVKELWSSTLEAWFPDGPDDPEVRLLKFTADGAEYWDSPGGRVATLFSFVKSKVTGEPYEGGDNAKLDL